MRSLFSLAAFFFALSLGAQNYSIQGILTDAEAGEPLPGAHILLVDQESGQSKAQVTQNNGAFRFDYVKDGTYDLQITFLGFASVSQVVKVEGKSVDLGNIKMAEDAIQLESVQVTEMALPALQKGDTTEYSAQSYKVLPDANAEDLIAKMPSVSVQNGRVQAQGEQVQRVLVDGKEFFGNDPTAALRSLPAEVIDKIQVFDQQSEQAQFTGFQDGETTKTINIITKSNMRAGQFGKVYGGYGFPDDYYQAGGQINIFNKDQRISIIGMSNNINQQNFAAEDLLGVVGGSQRSWGGSGRMRGGGGVSAGDFLVPQQGGIAQTHAFGINYSDKWGKKTQVAASYFFNRADNDQERLLFRTFNDTSEFKQFYNEENNSRTTNSNHRLNARVEIELDSSNSLIFRPRFSWQGNDGSSDIFGETFRNELLSGNTESHFKANQKALDADVSLLWRHKFAKDRRTISIYTSGGYAPKRGENSLLSENSLLADTSNQIGNLDAYNWNTDLNIDYTEPLGENGMLILGYRGDFQRDDSEREFFDFVESTQDYTSINPDLSNIFSNDYVTHRMGLGYRWRKDKWMLVTRAYYQRADLLNEQTFPENFEFSRTFNNLLPVFMIRYEKSRNDNFRIFYRARTELPSIEQMQNVLNNSNPNQLTVGNPELVQALQHFVFARYSKTNTEKSTVLYVLLRGSVTNDYIGTQTFTPRSDAPILAEYGAQPGAQLSRPENFDGYYNASSMITYGFPMKPLKLNITVDLSGGYTRTPGSIDEDLNVANNTNAGLGLTLASNISDKIDFSLSNRSSYNWLTNTLSTGRDANFLNQSATGRLNWIFWKGFILRTNLTYQYFDGLSEELDPNYWLWTVALGKKVFKNQRGEINLSVFDVFKQNNSLSWDPSNPAFTDEIQTNVIQRFVMLNFIYNLRNFGQAPERPESPDGGRPPHWH